MIVVSVARWREGQESLHFGDLAAYQRSFFGRVAERIVQLTQFLQTFLQLLREPSPHGRSDVVKGHGGFGLGVKKAAGIAGSGLFVGVCFSERTVPKQIPPNCERFVKHILHLRHWD